jgi:archaemetzincin
VSPSSDQRIVISPIGSLDAEWLPSVRRAVTRIFGFPTEIASLLHSIDFAYHEERRQYHSTTILERLAGRLEPSQIRILGFTDRDLFIPILTHVYGEAQLGGRAALVSTHRLQQGLDTPSASGISASRMVKEAVHELGHTFDLRHCREPGCIMHYCRSLKDVDAKSDELCRYCRVLLQDALQEIRLGSRP